MADAKLDASMSDLSAPPEKQDIDATFIVGDIKMETSGEGRALDDYIVVVGLAPNQSTSLLNVKYSQGKGTLGHERRDLFSYAMIDISPIRFVRTAVLR